MARFTKKRKQEIGLAPDELYFRGERKVDDVTVRAIDFNAEEQVERYINRIKEATKFIHKDSVTWININGLHSKPLMEEISTELNFDSLILADVMDTQTRSKSNEYSNCIALSIKMLQLDKETDIISVENISLVMTKSVLISFQEKEGDVFEPVRERIKNQKKRIRTSGTDYLMYALIDIIIDNYIYIISILGDKIEDLDERLLSDPNQSTVEEINTFKRELNFIRKNIKPAKEMILSLSKMESEYIDEQNYIHFKELLDNINQAIETSDSYREILSDQLNIYHTTISSKLNDVMMVLTVFSVIFIPLTFIAGIYGTNFEVVPELKYKYSYFIMWGVMIVIAIIMLIYFKRKKWL